MKTGWGFVATWAAIAFGLGVSAANAQQQMYWVGSVPGQIVRANLDGAEFEVVVDVPQQHPWCIALDLEAGKLYWTDDVDNRIQRANLEIAPGETADNRTDIEDVFTASSSIWGITLDVSAEKMYWTTSEPSRIQRANLDGSAVEDLITTGLLNPWAIALDVASGKMYWTDIGVPNIQRADLDGSNVEQLAVGTASTIPYSLALDVVRGKMYWMSSGSMGLDSKIQCANLDGSEIEVLVDPSGFGYGIAVDPLSQHIYWTSLVFGGVIRANLDGTGVETLITDLSFQGAGLALDLRAAPVPTTSEWGIVAMTVLLVGMATAIIHRRRGYESNRRHFAGSASDPRKHLPR